MALPAQVGPLSIVVPDSPELGEFLDQVYALENSDIASGSKATLDDYRIQVGHLQKFFAELQRRQADGQPHIVRNVQLADINNSLVAGAMAWLKGKGDKHGTCNKFLRTIKAIHNFAIEAKELPLRKLTMGKYKVTKPKPRAWRPAQVGLLLEAAQAWPGLVGDVAAGKWHYAHLLFILNTGTRITATMETPTAGLDLDNGWVTIPGDVQKDDEDGLFDLLPITIEALRAIQPQRHKRIFDDWHYDRTQRQWPTLLKRLKKMLVAAGLFASVDEIPKRREFFHKLRRCFATFVAMKFGKRGAQEMCGHSHESVTDLYIDPTQTTDRPRMNDALADKLVPRRTDRQKKLFE